MHLHLPNSNDELLNFLESHLLSFFFIIKTYAHFNRAKRINYSQKFLHIHSFRRPQGQLYAKAFKNPFFLSAILTP